MVRDWEGRRRNMADNLHGYIALITGGSSGLGYEMAKQLLRQGATVIIAARGGKRLEEAREKLSAIGDVRAVAMDVRDEASVEQAAAWVAERFDHLDMAVSNAGIGNNAPGMEDLPPDHRFYDIPVSAVRAVLDTNLMGYFLVARRFVPLLTRPGQFPYGPSKAGGEAMCAILAEELRDAGIAVNVICPGGFTDTNMAPKGAAEAMRENGRPVLPPTVLNETISFLASPASAGITGEKIVGKDLDAWLKARGITFHRA